MERILKILIISIISFLVALWVITGVNSCNDKKAEQLTESDTDTTTMIGDTVELADDIFGEEVSPDSGVAVNTPPQTNTADNSELTNYVGGDEAVIKDEPVSKPETKIEEPKKVADKKPVSSSKPYFIVAGNYIDKSNADVMKRKLLKLNFNNAEVVNFDMSQYFTVIAGRYNTEYEAGNLASKLKNKGIDCYVKRRQN
jgi:hypothetical protein